MSGHSKWATIKHKKAATDAKRGQAFTKIIKELTVAAREGGGNPDTNTRLRSVMAQAKEMNMPSNNIDRAIKRGTGELPGITYETVVYEGYGPSGIAIIAEALTDNKNRTTAEVRNIFSKKSGNLAGSGSVNWMFTKKGYILVEKSETKISEDEMMSAVLDSGAEDMKSDAKTYEITCSVQDLETVKAALTEKEITFKAEITMIPQSTIKITGQAAKQVLELVESLEGHDDIQRVYANFDIPDEELDKINP